MTQPVAKLYGGFNPVLPDKRRSSELDEEMGGEACHKINRGLQKLLFSNGIKSTLQFGDGGHYTQRWHLWAVTW